MFHSNKIETLNLWGVKILIFLIPLLPIFVSTSLVFPYISGKNFAFRVLVGLAAALWISLAVINKEYRPRTSVITISILTFTFIVGMADLLGVNPYRSFWSNYERMEGYITILHLTLYFLIIKSVLKTKKDWGIFLNVIFAVSILVSFFAITMTIHVDPEKYSRYVMEYGTRASSTIGNPPFLASYLLLSIFIGIGLIFNTQKACLKTFYLLAILFDTTAIYLTGSRGAMLAGVAGVILSFFFIFRGMNISRKRFGILLMVLLLIVISAGFMVFSYSDLTKNSGDISAFNAQQLNPLERNIYRFTTMFSHYSINTRLEAWEMALNAVKERPLLGWGQENFIAVYTVNPIPLVHEHIWMDRAHNIVIEWLVNAGFLGLFSYLALFASAFYFIRQAFNKKTIKRPEAVTLFIALIVYFLQNLLTFDTINTYFIFFALLAYIDHIEFIGESSAEGSKDNIEADNLKVRYMGILFAALLVFSGTCYYLNYKPMEKSRHIVKMGFSSPENDSYSLLLDDFNHALSINALGDEYLRKSMLSVSSQILKTKYFNREGALKLIQATGEELWKGIAVNRYNLKYYHDLINIYTMIAQYEPSYIKLTETLIYECLRMNPQFQWAHMAMTDIYILKKDYEGAFKNINEIVDMDPENEEKLLKLALVSTYALKEVPLNQALEKLKEIRLSRDENIISKRKSSLALAELYQLAIVNKEIENYPEALKYLNDIIMILSFEQGKYFEKDIKFYRPKRIARIHIEIARAYLKLNNKEAALKAVEKALKIDTNLPDDAKTLINSLNNGI